MFDRQAVKAGDEGCRGGNVGAVGGASGGPADLVAACGSGYRVEAVAALCIQMPKRSRRA